VFIVTWTMLYSIYSTKYNYSYVTSEYDRSVRTLDIEAKLILFSIHSNMIVLISDILNLEEELFIKLDFGIVLEDKGINLHYEMDIEKYKIQVKGYLFKGWISRIIYFLVDLV
jgi:hypothetical protein